jgi:toxin ParE1/3/4
MRLVFAESAASDLEDIIDYIASDNPSAAERVYRAIQDAAGKLSEFPEIGRPGRLPQTRELSVAGLPYIIVYQTGAGSVTIVAVLHGARDLVRILRDRQKGLDP